MGGYNDLESDGGRIVWQNPSEILRKLGLTSGSVLVDLGSGDGFFAIPAAKIVGGQGQVFALDINPDAIRRLRARASEAGLHNITYETGRAEDASICEECADLVFLGIVLHDFEPSRVLLNAKRMLRKTGRLVDLDWKKKPMKLGPPVEIRFSEDYASRLIESAGFGIESRESLGPYNYLIVAKPLCRNYTRV